IPGTDYFVVVTADSISVKPAVLAELDDTIMGGFHFAPGGNAPARQGGDKVPAINPCSLWDVNFRPGCPNPLGMTLVTMPAGGRFWADIYLTGVNHLTDGTSKFGVTIADG